MGRWYRGEARRGIARLRGIGPGIFEYDEASLWIWSLTLIRVVRFGRFSLKHRYSNWLASESTFSGYERTSSKGLESRLKEREKATGG